MIPEIGIMVGLFVLTRLVPGTWRRLSVLMSTICALVTIVVLADLLAQRIGAGSLMNTVIVDRQLAGLSTTPIVAAPTPIPNTTTVTKADGGRITARKFSGEIAFSEHSSLHREWIVVHDTAMPVDIEGTPGVETIYWGGRAPYLYRATGKIRTSVAISALELRFLTFDVWGTHTRTLSLVRVTDVGAGDTVGFEGLWDLYADDEVEQHFASIGFVARVRLADGRVIEANYAPVLEEARKFAAQFSAAELEPKKEPPPDALGGGKNVSTE